MELEGGSNAGERLGEGDRGGHEPTTRSATEEKEEKEAVVSNDKMFG
jgi:hypothetical protein